jgi:hypothetical protein
MRKESLFIGFVCCAFFMGCSGRTPDPVLCYQIGDDKMNCEDLKVEMAKVRREMAIKSTKIKERDARNLWLALMWPIGSPFEMDILKAEEIEIQALNTRYNRLFMIAVEKGCSLGNRTMTIGMGREPTVNEILEDKLPSETAQLLYGNH